MLSRRQALAGFGAAISCLLPGVVGISRDAKGTPFQPLTPDRLAVRAHRIAVGKSKSATSRWELIGDEPRIVTYHVVEVEEWVAGDTRLKQHQVRVLGGRVGNLAQYVPQEARIIGGSSALLFLHRLDGETSTVLGLAQGLYRIDETQKSRPLLSTTEQGCFLHKDVLSKWEGVPLQEALRRIREVRDAAL